MNSVFSPASPSYSLCVQPSLSLIYTLVFSPVSPSCSLVFSPASPSYELCVQPGLSLIFILYSAWPLPHIYYAFFSPTPYLIHSVISSASPLFSLCIQPGHFPLIFTLFFPILTITYSFCVYSRLSLIFTLYSVQPLSHMNSVFSPNSP
jgi:hypothetical protein